MSCQSFDFFCRSYWNIFDFALLLAALADLILDYVDAFTNFNKAESKASKITAAGKLVRIVRLIRLVRIFRDSYPKLLKWCESKIDTKMAFAYDVGKVNSFMMLYLYLLIYNIQNTYQNNLDGIRDTYFVLLPSSVEVKEIDFLKCLARFKYSPRQIISLSKSGLL